MTITLNGESREFADVSQLTITELVERLELGPQPVLVELAGEAIFEREFSARQVNDGDVVEIVRMVAGG